MRNYTEALLLCQRRIAGVATQIGRRCSQFPRRSQTGTLPLLWRFVLPLRLFLLRPARFRSPRRGLLALWLKLRTRFRWRRRTTLGLRSFARRRSLRPLSRLAPVGRRLTHFRSIAWLRRLWTAPFRPSVWLRCRRTIRFRTITRLRCRRTIRFRLVIRLRRPGGASGIVHWTRGGGISRGRSCGTIGWRVIRRSRRFGRCDGAVVKCSRLRSSRNSGLALFTGSPLLRFRAASLRMLSLNRYRWNMLLTRRRHFLRPWTRADPTSSAVIADPVHRGAVDHCG